jgi:uncharacterized damage-inducible protein DinB
MTNSNQQIFVTTALKSWDVWTARAGKLFDSLTDEQMQSEIAPGKNRPYYLLGHLVAVDDAMIPQLRLGEPDYAHLREPFIDSADKAAGDPVSTSELRQAWKMVHDKLRARFEQLSPAEWLERHSTVSEEDFAKEPHRNRLAILMSRTGHISYHIGQLMLLSK